MLPDDDIVPEKEEILSGISMISDKHVDTAPVTGAKRKHKDTRL